MDRRHSCHQVLKYIMILSEKCFSKLNLKSFCRMVSSFILFEQTPGYSEEQGSLACCSPNGCRESDMT